MCHIILCTGDIIADIMICSVAVIAAMFIIKRSKSGLFLCLAPSEMVAILFGRGGTHVTARKLHTNAQVNSMGMIGVRTRLSKHVRHYKV